MFATEVAMSASAPWRTVCTVWVAWLSAVAMSLADVTAACASVVLSGALAYCWSACFSLLSWAAGDCPSSGSSTVEADIFWRPSRIAFCLADPDVAIRTLL